MTHTDIKGQIPFPQGGATDYPEFLPKAKFPLVQATSLFSLSLLCPATLIPPFLGPSCPSKSLTKSPCCLCFWEPWVNTMAVRIILQTGPPQRLVDQLKLGKSAGCFQYCSNSSTYNRFSEFCVLMSTGPWDVHWGHDYCCYHKTNYFTTNLLTEAARTVYKNMVSTSFLYYFCTIPSSSLSLNTKALREYDEGGLWLPSP